MAYSLEQEIDYIFWGKYTRSHLSPPGNTMHVESLICEDVKALVKGLRERIAELEEYKFMYEGLG